jgi:DNA (cytosine-5)-methyltransferase 1
MRYLSVCSGIEAASVAWHHLGWSPVAFSEIEPFPSAVLAHHYPNVPNFGDMTQHEQWPLQPGSIDLLVGGTPCQSFSVAGLRKGLHDPRGGLMLTYLKIARRLRPQWVVWENVPGVLSSNGGRDFGSFLGALGLLGYGVAYRVLDAQWVRTHGHPRAVPQRRRRVFVVGCLGDWERAAAVLFERESVQRDSAPRRAPRQGAPADAEAGARAGCWWDGGGCAGTLTKQNAGGAQRMPDKDNFGAVLQPVVVRSGSMGGFVQDDVGGTMRAQGGDYHGGSESLVMWPADVAATLDRSSKNSGSPGGSNQEIFSQHGANLIPQPVPFTKSKRAQSVTDDETWVDGQVNPTLSLFDQGDTRATTVAVAFANRTRDGIKVPEIMADGIVPALTNPGDGGRSDAINVAVGFNWQNGGGYGNANDGLGITVEGTGPLQRCNTPAVAQAMTVRRLTPRECERLQGFPDDYTLIPWRKKAADECPDGPRYKALGNSMAVNCMAWIGERIAAVEARP